MEAHTQLSESQAAKFNIPRALAVDEVLANPEIELIINLTIAHTENSRGIGVADMAEAIRRGRPHRANGDLALHVLNAMHAALEASETGRHVELTKHYDHDITIDWNTGQTIRGADAVLEAFVAQLGSAKQAGIEEMGGVPFDLDNKAAYLSGDFSTHIAALDAYINGMDDHLLNYTIWNYTSDNTNAHGLLMRHCGIAIASFRLEPRKVAMNLMCALRL